MVGLHLLLLVAHLTSDQNAPSEPTAAGGCGLTRFMCMEQLSSVAAVNHPLADAAV